jgi:hypothetical protein
VAQELLDAAYKIILGTTMYLALLLVAMAAVITFAFCIAKAGID